LRKGVKVLTQERQELEICRGCWAKTRESRGKEDLQNGKQSYRNIGKTLEHTGRGGAAIQT